MNLQRARRRRFTPTNTEKYLNTIKAITELNLTYFIDFLRWFPLDSLLDPSLFTPGSLLKSPWFPSASLLFPAWFPCFPPGFLLVLYWFPLVSLLVPPGSLQVPSWFPLGPCVSVPGRGTHISYKKHRAGAKNVIPP